jgi:hypothetical protein
MLKLLLTLQLALPQAAAPAPIVYHGRLNQTTVSAPKREEAEIKIDGLLSEANWSEAALLTGFSRYQPVDGLPAEDSTEVLIWYTDHAMYIGVRAFEPHASVHAKLADRDRITADDYVYFMLDTFNDRRRALVFAANPLGVQSDGVIDEGRGGDTDLSPDYLFQSKGRVTDYGYELEFRIPFKSLRYPTTQVQDWGFNVVRRVQHSGQDLSWTPAVRARNSFLAQSGTLTQLTELKRGLVLEVNPVMTGKVDGTLNTTTNEYKYASMAREFSGNVRWGVTANLTMNATANPDFSQVEADVAQVNFDPRQSLFFAEKRPFFLDAIEQFAAPNNLIYTRRVVNPDAAMKFTGKVGTTNIGFLSAVDGEDFSRLGSDRPVYNILRARRDVGAQSVIGLVYTDKIDGSDYNRVAAIDARFAFNRIYTFFGQVAGSFWQTAGTKETTPLWEFSLARNGRRYGFGANIEGTHDDFVAGGGFISRAGIVHSNINNRVTFYGTPNSRLQAYQTSLVFDNTWDYQEFEEGVGPDDIKLHWNNTFLLRGGWNIGVNWLLETFRYPDQLYTNYWVVNTSPSGAVIDTTKFEGRRRIPNYDLFVTFSTPQWPKFSANGNFVIGRDENFEEWAPGYIFFLTANTDYRPTNKLRVNFRYVEQRTVRPSDNSVVRLSRIPRLKLEYQVARPLFVRLVGQYVADQRAELRDDAGNGDPIVVCNAARTSCSRGGYFRQNFRGDVLVSYQPTPGTVFYAGYGSSAVDSGPFDFKNVTRTSDGFFVKLSYLLRL